MRCRSSARTVLSIWHHNMYDFSFTLKERRKEALPRVGGYVVAVLCLGGMINIPQHETDKMKRGQRSADGDAAILVLSKRQMRYGVCQFSDDLYTGIEIKAQWKWHNVLHNRAVPKLGTIPSVTEL